MPIIRIGILGAAKIAPKAVIEPARDNPEFKIVAVAARDRSRAEAFAAANGIPFVAENYPALIARDDVDLVYNALPPAGHAPWSIAAASFGKAVLCEKPFAMTAAEARMMVAAAAAAKRPLIEAFHNRFHPMMRRAVEIVASGELGLLKEAEATFNVPIAYRPGELRWIAEQGGGALMDLGCYCIHALRTLAMCEPKVVSASCKVERGVDARTNAELVFSNGMTAKLRTSMTSLLPKALLQIKGEKGSLEFVNFVAPHVRGWLKVKVHGKTTVGRAEGPTTYEAQLAHVGDVMLRGAKPLTGGEDAIANMACIDAIYKAAGFVRARLDKAASPG